MVKEHLGNRPYHLCLCHQPQPSQNLHLPLMVGPLLGPLSYIFIFCVSPQLLHRDGWAPFQGSPNDIKSCGAAFRSVPGTLYQMVAVIIAVCMTPCMELKL